LAVAECFWQLYSSIFVGGVDNSQEENCSLFEAFSSQFLEKMLKREFLTKTGITNLRRSRDSHLRVGLLLANGFALGSRSNEQNKNSNVSGH
jgi:hypothetical protein